ncbi:hypothetical protein CERZMDRAFT_96546 [Cercospora zeae-maydis SCOH1-5]|uniref:Uncharacterized protein n=1 Tax=Cercospora zeae-maydis SCOH1-5 TaxID=717836 RepID=A0A6A6FK11_9PEZI|nr:hypothetical protein CERZMDRAFT_96546 [Cercospora zeae-maydis SCOH1-5]
MPMAAVRFDPLEDTAITFGPVKRAVNIHSGTKNRMAMQGYQGDDTPTFAWFRDWVQPPVCEDAGSVSASCVSFTRSSEAVSQNTTRMIFGWLPCDGHAAHEAGIWNHESIDMSDSDEDESHMSENAASRSHGSQVMSWPSHIRTKTGELHEDMQGRT